MPHVDDMTADLQQFLSSCGALAASKNRDYHPDRVAMLEILQTSWESGVTPVQDIWGRMRKQLSALRRYILEGHVESEPPKSRLMDVANYCAILNYWIEHRRAIVLDALVFVGTRRSCETVSTSPVYNKPGQCRCDRCEFYSWLHKQLDASVSVPTAF